MLKQAVVLAGGLGTRLQPITTQIPKPMVLVAGKPFLQWQLEYLRTEGISDVLLLVGRLAEVIKDHFAKHPVAGIKISYSEEPAPLGTGGALRLAANQLDERFWLFNGDSFIKLNLKSLYSAYDESWLAGIAALSDLNLVPVPANLKVDGRVVTEYRKAAGREAGFSYVDAGVYILRREIVAGGDQEKFDMETWWPALIEKRKLGILPVKERFFDIGTPERLKIFEEHIHDYF